MTTAKTGDVHNLSACANCGHDWHPAGNAGSCSVVWMGKPCGCRRRTPAPEMTTAKARALGYAVDLGAYSGTTDDRADRWYLRLEDGGPIDRRGRGWATRQAALDAIAERVAMAEAAPQ